MLCRAGFLGFRACQRVICCLATKPRTQRILKYTLTTTSDNATGERKAVMSRLSFQFPALLAEQVRAHAARLDRSVGWVLTTAWRIAEPKIAAMVAPPKETP